MKLGQGRFDVARTIVSEADTPVAWVVLAAETNLDTLPVGVAADLVRNGMSVMEVALDRRTPKAAALEAIRRAASSLEDRAGSLPVLFGGVGPVAPLAATVAGELEAPGLLSIDGSLLSVAWRGASWTSPTLLISTTEAGAASRLALRAGNLALGRQGQLAGRLGTAAADQRLREWRRAADAGQWATRPGSISRRLAAPAAAVIALSGGATLLAASPVSAAQRQGDGVGATASASSAKATLGGKKVGQAQRQGDHAVPHATGSVALEDKAGMKWFVNTDITFSTTSSASGAMSEASYQQPVAASTLNGGTTASTLNDAYDGYNAIHVSVNGTVCTETAQAGCTTYYNNGPASLSCNNRVVNTGVQSIDGLRVSRQVYVPTDDHFSRFLNTFTNPGSSPITVTVTTANNLGSDNNTIITGTSAGGTTVSDADTWVTTFQNWSGTTTSDPRLGHVLQGPNAPVKAQGITFANGNDNPYWHYTFTVAPGATVNIANFGVADPTKAASQADSARLAALPPTALECMTPTQISELANFNTDTGYWTVASDGGIFSFGSAQFLGSMGGSPLNKPVVGMAPTPDHQGYWLVASDGGIFSFGDAKFYGSTGSLQLNQPVVGMAATPDGKGYWLVASDGGLFAFGDAVFYGSTGSIHLNKPVVGMASTADGLGYWLVASDGGIFAYGDAKFYGSTGSIQLNKPVVGMAATPDGKGYWLVASDGGIFAYGDAVFHGSAGNLILNKPIVGMDATPSGGGYRLVASDGGVFAYGDANFFGSTGSLTLNKPVVGMANG
jgi:hypothetical protein